MHHWNFSNMIPTSPPDIHRPLLFYTWSMAFHIKSSDLNYHLHLLGKVYLLYVPEHLHVLTYIGSVKQCRRLCFPFRARTIMHVHLGSMYHQPMGILFSCDTCRYLVPHATGYDTLRTGVRRSWQRWPCMTNLILDLNYPNPLLTSHHGLSNNTWYIHAVVRILIQ